LLVNVCIFFFQAEDGIRDFHVTGVQTCALPIYEAGAQRVHAWADSHPRLSLVAAAGRRSSAISTIQLADATLQEPLLAACAADRSEEHTSELQSRENLVCRLLLEKKKQQLATYH